MKTKLALSAGLALAAFAATAQAGITDPVLDITASSSLGTATFRIQEGMGTWSGDTWSMLSTEAIELYDSSSGQLVGTVRDLYVEFIEDP